MPQLSLTLFGPPQIESNGLPLKITRRKAIALLAYLAVSGQSHSRDSLATLFWPEADRSRARAALRSALWVLNKTMLAHFLEVESEQVALRPSPTNLTVDVLHFREKVAAWQQHNHNTPSLCPDCVSGLTEATVLYQNDFMAGFTLPDTPLFDEWQFFQSSDLRQKLAEALTALCAYYRDQGQPAEAIPFGRRLVVLDPLHEPAQRLLMQIYAEAGQQSAALRQFDQCRQVLHDELDVEPSPETLALFEALKSGGRKEETAVSTPPQNLPPDPTPFIGRQQERTQLASYLEDTPMRLITILGPGGIGKTRLALATAADAVANNLFPDGIYFVQLAPVTAPSAIIPAIGEAVGFPFQEDGRSPQQQLYDYLRPRQILLLLDNVEQLLPAGAEVVTALLQQAPHLKLLITSRERLNLVEEQGYPLAGLDVTDTAVTLLRQAIHRRLPSYEMTADEASEICRLVDGIPLALELAATWADVLSPREIAAHIRRNLDFLETDLRNLPARHRSMRAVFDTTWRSLNQREQDVYARLSLFHGGFTAEAAQAVAGASLKMLSAFIGKSLLRFNPRRKRYENHELLRQFAAQNLADNKEAQQRHARYTCAFLHQLESQLKGSRQPQALMAIEQDLENIRAAWQWAVVHKHMDFLAQALESLAMFYRQRKRFGEGAVICQRAVSALLPAAEVTPSLSPEAAVLTAHLFAWLGVFQLGAGQIEPARRSFQQAQALLDGIEQEGARETAVRAFLRLQRSFYVITNDFGGEAIMLNEESLALYRAIGDEWGVAQALDALGQKYLSLGQFEKARQLQEECLVIRERLGDQPGMARTYNLLGLLVLHTGHIQQSDDYLRQSLALYRQVGSRSDQVGPMAVMAINQLFGGQFETCVQTVEACWAIHRELGLAHEPFTANLTVGRALVDLGRYDEAESLMTEVLFAYRQSNYAWGAGFALLNLGRVWLAAGDAAQALTCLQESDALLRQMSDRTLLPDTLFCLGLVYRLLGKRPSAMQFLRDGLGMVVATMPLNPMRFELPLLALLRLDEGKTAQAVELYAAAQQSHYVANSRWFADVAGREIEAAANTLQPEMAAAARARGQAHDLAALVLALWDELGEG